MTQPINDGGPAFPADSTLNKQFLGMSLRDYFAAAVVCGMAASVYWDENVQAKKPENEQYRIDTANAAFAMADAMLAARDRK